MEKEKEVAENVCVVCVWCGGGGGGVCVCVWCVFFVCADLYSKC